MVFLSVTCVLINLLSKNSDSMMGKHVRLAHARHLLVESHLSVSETAFVVGFQDANYFTRLFRRRCGKTPTAFMAGRLQLPRCDEAWKARREGRKNRSGP